MRSSGFAEREDFFSDFSPGEARDFRFQQSGNIGHDQ
jgi:hypothetical protein